MSELSHADVQIGYALNTGQVFSVDQQDILQAFPGIEHAAAFAIEGKDSEVKDIARSKLGEYGLSITTRQMRKTQEALQDVSLELMDALTEDILTQGHENPRLVVANKVGHWFMNNPVALQMLADQVEEMVKHYRNLYSSGEQTTQEIVDLITNNPIAQYEMTKVLADDDQTEEMPSAGFMLHLLSRFGNATLDGMPINEKLRTDLEEGKFDEYIAYDILDARGTDDEEANTSIRKIISLETFMTRALPELSATDIRYRVAENIDAWPLEMKASLVKMRNELVRRLNRNIYSSSVLAEGLQIETSADSFENIMQRLAVSVAAAQQTMQGGKARVGHTRRNQPNVRMVERTPFTPKRRRTPRQPEVAAPTTASAETEPVMIHPLELLTVSGEKFAQDTPEFKDLVKTYLDKFKGAANLETVVNDALDYLSKLDMSAGMLRGIKKFKEPIKRGDGKMDLFEFKPADVPGLSTGGERGRAMRIFFSFDADSILIHEILDRREKVAVESRLRQNFASQSA